VTRRGYNPGEVDEYMRYLGAQILMLAADRAAVVEHRDELLRRVERESAETDRLRDQLHRLLASPSSAEGLSGRMAVMLELATEEVSQLRTSAREEARAVVAQAEIGRRRNEQLRRRLDYERNQVAADQARLREMLAPAHQEAERISADAAARAEELVAAARGHAERIRSEVSAEAVQLREHSERQRQELNAQAADERARIEQDFAVELASRREETVAALAQLLADARGQADRITAQARHVAAALESAAADDRAEANRLLADARGQAERITAQCRVDADRLLADARTRADHTTTQARRAAAELTRTGRKRASELQETDSCTRSRLAELRGVLDREIARLSAASPAPPNTPQPADPASFVPLPRLADSPRSRPSAASASPAPGAP
jgi:cell division septum initiation protein DivIVA